MFIIIFLTCIIGFFTARLWLKVRKLPPGPFPLPLLGNTFQIGYALVVHGNFVNAMKKWTEAYGPVFTLWFGPFANVTVADYDIAYEAMVKSGALYADRTGPFLMDVFRDGRGIIVSNDQHWIEQRRFALHTLRNFGLGKNLMEQRIMEEFELRCEQVDKELAANGGRLNPHRIVDLLVGNIINRILFSERFDEKNEAVFFDLKHRVDRLMEEGSFIDLIIDKWNKNLPFFRNRFRNFLEPLDSVCKFLNRQVEERKQMIANKSHVIEGEGRDYVDAFLIQIEKDQKEGNNSSFDEKTLAVVLLDLWLAGQETTTTTLLWGFIYLIKSPEVQQKIREEIENATGNNRPLSLTDRTVTPYFTATLSEIQRLASIVTLNLWRSSKQDTVVGGYTIPKGTAICAQLSLIMSNEKLFKDCDKFNPDRYFDDSKITEHVIPFGIGKRACPGESLARAELYLIIGNLIQRYIMSSDPSLPPQYAAMNEKGFNRRPANYSMILEKI